MLNEARSALTDDDPAALLVAATWTWTRFNAAANAELVRILADHGLPLTDPEDLKQVDQILHSASVQAFAELYGWCMRSRHLVLSGEVEPAMPGAPHARTA